MARTVRSLLAQLSPVPAAPEANARRAADVVASAQAELVVFPELWLGGYDLARLSEAAVDADSPAIGMLRQAAATTGSAIVVGFAEWRGAGRVANAAALIDGHGELAGIYRKVQLFGQEQEAFEPGDELVVVELAGCPVGPLICFDMEFPEAARALARAGAGLLVTVAANMEPFYSDHRIASQARALDNRLPHLYCNRCGEEAGLRFVGGSRAVRSDGTIASEAGESEETLGADLPLGAVEDDRVDYLALLREPIGVRAVTTATGGSR